MRRSIIKSAMGVFALLFGIQALAQSEPIFQPGSDHMLGTHNAFRDGRTAIEQLFIDAAKKDSYFRIHYHTGSEFLYRDINVIEYAAILNPVEGTDLDVARVFFTFVKRSYYGQFELATQNCSIIMRRRHFGDRVYSEPWVVESSLKCQEPKNL